MNERIKKAREWADLSMGALARAIGVTPSAISLMESGKRTPTNRTIRDIANACGVSLKWLETGEGEMVPDAPLPGTPEAVLLELIQAYGLDESEIELVQTFLTLPDGARKAVVDFVVEAAAKINAAREKEKEEAPESPAQKRRRLHDELDRQLDLEESTMGRSSDLLSG